MKWKLILTLALAGASFADQRTSIHIFRNGWHERNPVYGANPSTGRFVTEHTVINAAQLVLLWKAKGKTQKLAKLLVVGEIVEDGVAAAHNANLPLHPPGYLPK